MAENPEIRDTLDEPYRRPVVTNRDVRKAAARAAVAASKRTGRPVAPWIKELAESP